MTKNYITLGIVSLFLFSCGFVDSKEDKTVTLHVSLKVKLSQQPNINLDVNFKNISKQSFFLYRYYFCESGFLMDDIFTITRIENKKSNLVSYGRLVDFHNIKNATQESFLRLNPGEEISCRINISNYYDLQNPGKYEVKYMVRNPRFSVKQPEIRLESNTSTFMIDQ